MFQPRKSKLLHENLYVMGPGEDSPYIEAMTRASSKKYTPPPREFADGPVAHIQEGVLVRLKSGLTYLVTDLGAIHMGRGKFGWIRNEALLEKAYAGEVQCIFARKGFRNKLRNVWGNPSPLPDGGEEK